MQLVALSVAFVLVRRGFDVSAFAPGTAVVLELGLVGLVSATGLLVTLAIARRWDDRRVTDYGLVVSRSELRACGVGVVVGGLTYAVPTGGLLLLGAAELTGTFVSPVDAPERLLVAVAITLVAIGAQVVFEEVAFRAVLLRNFAEGLTARRLSARQALVVSLSISSVMFGAIHLIRQGGGGVDGRSVELLVTSTLLGVFWGGAYILTGRLSVAVGLHWGHNVWPLLFLRPEQVVLTPPALGTIAYSVGLYELTIGKVCVGLVCLGAWSSLTPGGGTLAEQVRGWADGTDSSAR